MPSPIDGRSPGITDLELTRSNSGATNSFYVPVISSTLSFIFSKPYFVLSLNSTVFCPISLKEASSLSFGLSRFFSMKFAIGISGFTPSVVAPMTLLARFFSLEPNFVFSFF
jgi:hypothetical protein